MSLQRELNPKGHIFLWDSGERVYLSTVELEGSALCHEGQGSCTVGFCSKVGVLGKGTAPQEWDLKIEAVAGLNSGAGGLQHHGIL